VEAGLGHDVFHREGKPLFVGVDGLVLRPVVHEEAADLRHAADEEEVAHQDPHLDEARQEVVEDGVAGRVQKKAGEKAGEDDEKPQAQEEAEGHGGPKGPLGHLFFSAHQLGAPGQGPVADGEGVKEGHHPPEEGEPGPGVALG
jgi:hypothetical protein